MALAPALIVSLTGCVYQMQRNGAQEQTSGGLPPLVTDRPDQTESSETVTPGYMQLEVGGSRVDSSDKGDPIDHEFAAPETLIRLGLARALELRLIFDGYQMQDVVSKDGNANGFGDTAIGFKYKLFEQDGFIPQTALLAHISMPTGADGHSSEEWDPDFRINMSNELNEMFSLAYNLGVEWETAPSTGGDRDTDSFFIYTVALGIGLTEEWGMFLEFFGDAPLNQRGGDAHSFDAGITYLVHENLQLDTAVGIGLTSEAPDWFATVGFSWRFPVWGDAEGSQIAQRDAGMRTASMLLPRQ
jgi:hypothetical protein